MRAVRDVIHPLVKTRSFLTNAFINFNQPDQEKLEEVTVSQLKGWISKNQFAPGSMLPKIEAAITFVENSQNGIAIITSLEKVNAFFEGGFSYSSCKRLVERKWR